MFLKKLKEKIVNVAHEAVFEAEKIFGSGGGSAKKRAAIEFVTKALALPPFVEKIIALFLSAFIDAAIETALKSLPPKTPPAEGSDGESLKQ